VTGVSVTVRLEAWVCVAVAVSVALIPVEAAEHLWKAVWSMCGARGRYTKVEESKTTQIDKAPRVYYFGKTIDGQTKRLDGKADGVECTARSRKGKNPIIYRPAERMRNSEVSDAHG